VFVFFIFFMAAFLSGDAQPLFDSDFPVTWTKEEELRAKAIAVELEKTESSVKAMRLITELEGLGQAARFAVPSMWAAMEKLDTVVTEHGNRTMTQFSFMSGAMFPSTVLFPNHPNSYFQQWVEVTNKASTEDLEIYRALLSDPDAEVRRKALRLIIELGPEAVGLFAELYGNVLKDDFAGNQAVQAIGGMGFDSLLVTLRKGILDQLAQKPGDPHTELMLMTTEALMGNRYWAVIQDATNGSVIRRMAIEDFRGINRLDEVQAAALVDALYDDARAVRNESAKTLIHHSQMNLEVVVLALIDKLDTETGTNSAAAFVLQKISKQSLPVFLEMLEDVDASQRLLGANLIRKLGKSANSAAGKLEELANEDIDPEVRDAAIRALAAINQGQAEPIELSPPSTTVSNYLITSEEKARWLRAQISSTWSAGFTFGSLPATLPTSGLRLALYDAFKNRVQTGFVSDAFTGVEPGVYFLKVFRNDGGEDTVIPFKIDILAY
ncbi:MAG: hypothetical protein KJT03_17785, partial [Verrucomicrobiae bacterium]|nr:hypothetical protein [Verrucomicrobiae bacterium]